MEKQIKLEESGFTAHLKTSISYGEHQAMQAILMAGAKNKINPATQQVSTDFESSATIEWTFKKMMTVITKFENKEGKPVQVTRKTIEDLPLNDGEKLEEEVDKVIDSLKKKQEKSAES